MLEIGLVLVATVVLTTLVIHQIGVAFEITINWKWYVLIDVLVVVIMLGYSYYTMLRLAS